MTKLISTYARSTGLRIAVPELAEHFFPHPFERFITIQTGSNQNAKCYSWFQEVVGMLKPILDANKIAMLLLGGKDDPSLNGVHDLRGKTSYLQSHYLVKRALCHLGTDSWLAHCAGMNHRPLVALYGSTDPGPHGPYWCDTAKTTLLVSHRAGGRPTFAMQEAPKTVDFIPPERVANAVLKLLGVTDLFTQTTLCIGPLYTHTIFELVPNAVPAPTFCPEFPMTVRMDLLFSEDGLAKTLSTGRKVHVITDRPINPQLLSDYRGQILSYSHDIVAGKEPSVEYTNIIRTLFPTNHAFFTRETDEKRVADLRLIYLDHIVVNVHRDATKDEWVKSALTYRNLPDTPENRLDIGGKLAYARFKSNKFVLSETRVFLSHAHRAAGKSIDSLGANTGDVIDDPAFWRDQAHFNILLP